ncbi:hypothetical protein CaCOL14_013152 [Colletotrichum acutatum]
MSVPTDPKPIEQENDVRLSLQHLRQATTIAESILVGGQTIPELWQTLRNQHWHHAWRAYNRRSQEQHDQLEADPRDWVAFVRGVMQPRDLDFIVLMVHRDFTQAMRDHTSKGLRRRYDAFRGNVSGLNIEEVCFELSPGVLKSVTALRAMNGLLSSRVPGERVDPKELFAIVRRQMLVRHNDPFSPPDVVLEDVVKATDSPEPAPAPEPQPQAQPQTPKPVTPSPASPTSPTPESSVNKRAASSLVNGAIKPPAPKRVRVAEDEQEGGVEQHQQPDEDHDDDNMGFADPFFNMDEPEPFDDEHEPLTNKPEPPADRVQQEAEVWGDVVRRVLETPLPSTMPMLFNGRVAALLKAAREVSLLVDDIFEEDPLHKESESES